MPCWRLTREQKRLRAAEMQMTLNGNITPPLILWVGRGGQRAGAPLGRPRHRLVTSPGVWKHRASASS